MVRTESRLLHCSTDPGSESVRTAIGTIKVTATAVATSLGPRARRDARCVLILSKAEGMELEFHQDRKSTRLNSSHSQISYAVFCLKKKKTKNRSTFILTLQAGSTLAQR